MKALKAVLIAILITALGVGAVQADWETRRVNDDYDDLMITTTGGIFQTSNWIEVVGGSVDLFNYYAFRSISIPNNSVIDVAYLEFEAPFPWNYDQECWVTINGLKAGDLTSWNPTPALNSHPMTTAYTDWNATDLISGHKINVTVTDIIQELYNQFTWESGNDMGVKISAIAVSGGQRFQVAHDSDSTKALKLYIEYSEGTVGTDYYYKGFKIENVTAGTTMQFDWTDTIDGNDRITTIQDTDYETHNFTQQWGGTARDNLVSVGNDIYKVMHNMAPPYNKSLFVSSDRGSTWTNKGAVTASSVSIQHARLVAMAYDQNGVIHIGFAESGYDTYYRNYTVASGIFSTKEMIYNGAYSHYEIRALWSQDTIWFTRYGGNTSSIARASVIRRQNGVWRDYTALDVGGTEKSDLTWASDRMYWIVKEATVTPAQKKLYAFELSDYSDFTSWVPVGNLSYPQYVDTGSCTHAYEFDVGTWNDDLVITVERHLAWYELHSYRWNAIAKTWNTWEYVVTGGAGTPYYRDPKMFYNSDDELWMGIQIALTGGYDLTYNDWDHFLSSEATPPTIIAKSTGHQMAYLGGDMFPYSLGVSGWNVTIGGVPFNNTCIQNAVTLEDIQACIDAYLNDTDPFDPDPPASNYPDHESFGRFDIKFYIWIIGQTLIFAPSIAIAWRKFPLIYYTYFAIMIMLGLGLLWSLSGM